MIQLGDYLDVEELLLTGKKTKYWAVTSRSSGDRLGSIHWYGPWRQYCFYPEPGSIFNKGCLRDLAGFCERETRTHLARPKP